MPGCCAIGCSNSCMKGFLMKRFPKDPQRRKEWALKVNRDKWAPKDSSYLCEINMPGCAATNCTNSFQKGFGMYSFPRDPDRKKEWIAKSGRKDWTPTQFSRICEVHFPPEMWEKPRVDGKKKLKLCAVPTLFPEKPSKKKHGSKLKRPKTEQLSPEKNDTKSDIKGVFPKVEHTSERRIPIILRRSRRKPVPKPSILADWDTSSEEDKAEINDVEMKTSPTPSVPLTKSESPSELAKAETSTLSTTTSPTPSVPLPNSESPSKPVKAETSTLSTTISPKMTSPTPSVPLTNSESPSKPDKAETSTLPKTSEVIVLRDDSSDSEMDVDKSVVDSTETDLVSVTRQSTILHTLTDKQKLEQYEKICRRKSVLLRKYKNQLRNCKLRCQRLEKTSTSKLSILTGIFNEDQLRALKKKQTNTSTKLMKWSDKTITQALKLRFAAGDAGYEEILKLNLPYPSIRTLQRRVANLKSKSGILEEVFDFLKLRADKFTKKDKDCVLILDEMAITPGTLYALSLDNYGGAVTLPQHSGTATHVLVFFLAGVHTRWKQIVAYFFTGGAINGSVIKDIIDDIIIRCDKIHLDVLSITSDMGTSSSSLWNTLGVTVGRHSFIRNSFKHPSDSFRKIYIIADINHVFESIKSMLVTNKHAKVPEDMKKKYKLSSNKISIDHIVNLIKFQNDIELQLAHKLTEDDFAPSSKASNIFNQEVCNALKFMAEYSSETEHLTTAWFFEQVEKWFHLMTSKSRVNALCTFYEEVYEITLAFLKDFMELMDSLEVGNKRLWKPAQTGVLVSTKSVLEIQEILFESKRYRYILTSRFSQD